MTDHAIVKESVAQIFRKCGYANLDRLTQRDFDHVSQEIQSATSILISSATIKRLLNGEFSRLPQVATLDAISKYLGHKNWQEHKLHVSAERHLQEVAQDTKASVTEIKREKPAARLKVSMAVYLLVAAATVFVVGFKQFTKNAQASNFDKATFAVKKNTANQIPNTVVFSYNIDGVNADSFFIQQSWDRNRRVQVFKNKHTLTDIYYEPGYHIAKLIANDSVIKAVEVSIPTDGWFVFARDLQPGSLPEYIPTWTPTRQGLLHVKQEDLQASKIDISRPKEYCYSYFMDSLKASSDNFILKTRVRMNEVRNNFCPYIQLELFTQRYFFVHKATSKGCANEAVLQFGEKSLHGKENDLAPLGQDVTEWMDMEWAVRDRQVQIRLNNKDVFSTGYLVDSRMITGLAFISNGLCEVDYVELKGLDGSIIYRDDFDSNPEPF